MSPSLPLAACSVPGCPGRATHRGRCQQHHADRERERRHRADHSHLHGSRRWREASAAFLAKPENALCFYCLNLGRKTPATCTDHRIAPKGDHQRFWDVSNWIPACGRCNTLKAINHEGGFGRATAPQAPPALGDDVSWG